MTSNAEIPRNLTPRQYLQAIDLETLEIVDFLIYFNLDDQESATNFLKKTIEKILGLPKASKERKRNKAIVKFAKGIKERGYDIVNSTSSQLYYIQCLQDKTAFNREKAFAQSAARITESVLAQPQSTAALKNPKIRLTYAPKRKLNEEDRASKRVFTESDGVYLDSFDKSFGSKIGMDARENMTAVETKKAIYFQTCGMNGIVDLSDKKKGSQLYGFTDEAQDEIMRKLISNSASYTIKNIIKNKDFDELAEKASEPGNDLFESLQDLDSIHCSKELYPNKCIYKHIISNVVYPLNVNIFSEADYIIEVWAPLIKYLFLGTSLCTHWGDTVPLHLKNNNSPVYFKLDLRIISTFSNNNDWAAGEAGINVVDWKYFTDKTKLVLTAKSQLNAFIKNYPDITKSTLSKIKIPFIQILGLNAVVLYLELHANGLYKIVQVAAMEFPVTKACLESGKLLLLTEGLSALKDLSLRLFNVIADLERAKNINGKKKMDRSIEESSSSNTGESVSSWVRDLWFPPAFENETTDKQ